MRGGLRIDGPAKGSKNTGSAGSNGARAGGVSLRALCMAVEHERQHQETLCYMLAQQRKADAAAAAAGRPPVLGAAVDGGEGLPAAPADAVQPFYLQQCSYASASLAQALPVPDGTPNNSGVPAEPATPSGADSLAGRLAALRLGPQPSPQAAPASAADADAAGSLVHIPAGQVDCAAPGCGACRGQRQHAQLAAQALALPARRSPWASTLPPRMASAGMWSWGGWGRWRCRACWWAPGPSRWPSFAALCLKTRWEGGRVAAQPVLAPDRSCSCLCLPLGPHRLNRCRCPGVLLLAGPPLQGYSRPELWDPTAFRHFAASGHSMPATWALQGRQLWVHMPEASYRWEQLADCPAYVRRVRSASTACLPPCP